MPGRGEALKTPESAGARIERHAGLPDRPLWRGQARPRGQGKDLKAAYDDGVRAAWQPKYGHWVIFDHCMPFDVSRAYDEAGDHPDPRIWTAERDQEMWEALEG
ncbi:MAG: hypothetical protein U5L11_03185 [Arhodomonas sp.]|nr:hypothetical protein [Arhodomonas sp.]